MAYPILSADSHITEPAGTYVDRIDPAFRERAPKLVRHEQLGDIFVVDGMKKPVPLGLVAAAGKTADQIAVFGAKFEELHRGGWDPDARLADQARDGVAGEILYPTVGMVLCNHRDFDYKKACFDAYNLWIAEYCSRHPQRLFGIGQTAVRNVPEAIADFEKIRALGLYGVMMPGEPQHEDYDHPMYDPLWQAAIDLRLPLSFHILTTREAGKTRGPRLNSFLSIIRGCQDLMGLFVFSGVFERFPRLKIVCVEADAGWAPHFMYRMDHAYDRHRYWLPAGTLSKRPSEYFAENIYLTFQDDWVAFQTTHLCNPRRLMWASDFPHSDSTWPRSQDVIREQTQALSDEQRRWILHDNVAELYGLEARWTRMEYDLKITGGTLVDGTGAPRRRGDVGIRAGRVVALGEAPGSARETLDAAERIVAPGFVDIHTHYDAQVLWDRMLSISPWHGVTSVVMGNCGFGVAPTRPQHRELILRTLEKVEGMSFDALNSGLGSEWPFETFPEYLAAIESRGVAINVAALVGHTPVRLYVMGEAATERAATPDEISRMRAIVDEALAAGAVGLATSKSPTHVGWAGRPVPSRLAEIGEIRALAGALGGSAGGILQATLGRGLFFDEFDQIAAETGCPISWTALLAGAMGPGSHRGVLARALQQQREGRRVIPQVSCRPLNFEFQWKQPFPFESMKAFAPVSTADLAGQLRIYRDPGFRRVFRESTETGFGRALSAWWERTVIASSPSEPQLAERPLAEVARERGVHPLDLALDLGLASQLEARFRVAIMNADEDEVAELLLAPHTVLGLSDAGAHASQLCDACFSTHLLGHWVREKATLPLEQAVHMLTARPADVFGLRDRGRLAVGLPADITIFDAARVGASPLRRVFDQPAGADRLVADPIGIDAVIVGGTAIRRDGKDAVDPAGPLPGRLLRHGSASP